MTDQAKNAILERIRSGKPQPLPKPDVPMYAFSGDPLESFMQKLIGFDGRAAKFRSRDPALAWLGAQPEMDLAKHRVYSTLSEVPANVEKKDLIPLQNAADIHACVSEGLLGVGEMGSILVTDESLIHPVCALLSRHLFILLDVKKIVGGLHEAYAQFQPREHQYASFFSGPSATADIEAVHITGAQGPLSLTALIYGIADAPEPPELLVNPNADSSVWQEL